MAELLNTAVITNNGAELHRPSQFFLNNFLHRGPRPMMHQKSFKISFIGL